MIFLSSVLNSEHHQANEHKMHTALSSTSRHSYLSIIIACNNLKIYLCITSIEYWRASNTGSYAGYDRYKFV